MQSAFNDKRIMICGTISQFMKKKCAAFIIFWISQVVATSSDGVEEDEMVIEIQPTYLQADCTREERLPELDMWDDLQEILTRDDAENLAVLKNGSRLLDMRECENPFAELMQRRAAKADRYSWLLSADGGVHAKNVLFWQYIDAKSFSIVRVMLGLNEEGRCIACARDESHWLAGRTNNNRISCFKTISFQNASSAHVIEVVRPQEEGIMSVCDSNPMSDWQHTFGKRKEQSGFFYHVGRKNDQRKGQESGNDIFIAECACLSPKIAMGTDKNDCFQICEESNLGGRKYAQFFVNPYHITLCIPVPLSIQCGPLPPYGGVPYVDHAVTFIPVFKFDENALVMGMSRFGRYFPTIPGYTLCDLGEEEVAIDALRQSVGVKTVNFFE